MTRAELAGGFGLPASLSISGQIEESFRRRVVELPPATRQFLTIAAAEPTGDPVKVWRAANELGITAPDAKPAVDDGLVDIGTRLWFRHPLVRTAAYTAATIGDRQAAHRALAEVTDPESEPDRRAWHRALGSPGPDEQIAQELECSADRARARGGFAAAGALLERSMSLTLDPVLRARRSVGAAAAHLEAGSFDRAATLLASIDTDALDELGRAYVDLLRARHAVFGGDLRDAAESQLRAAMRLEAVDLPFAALTYISAMGAATLAESFGRGVGIVDIAEVAMRCPRPEAPTVIDWLRMGLAGVTVDGPAAGAPALRRALDSKERDDVDAQQSQYRGYQVAAAVVLWDCDAYRDVVSAQVQAAREIGSLAMLPSALNSLAQLLVFEGDLDAAASAIAEADEISSLTGSNLVASAAALHAAVRGDAGAAARIAEQIARAQAEGLGMALKTAQWATAMLYNGLGQYEQAFAAGTDAIAHRWEWGSQLFFNELIEAASRCGQAAVGAAALDRLAETVEPSGTDWGVGIHRRSQALLAPDAAAEELYLESIDRLARTRIRLQLARGHLLYGEWLRRGNRRVDARTELRTAHDKFVEMGIHAFAERARRELLATGETVRRRSADTFDELTPQEAHIARLAGDGRTNTEIGAQLFISPRTVEWHLRKVFTKLGITSRRELRDTLP
jgi:DNA-binding CsgD family transcriptional regulator